VGYGNVSGGASWLRTGLFLSRGCGCGLFATFRELTLMVLRLERRRWADEAREANE
jgi:hypothetical protein